MQWVWKLCVCGFVFFVTPLSQTICARSSIEPASCHPAKAWMFNVSVYSGGQSWLTTPGDVTTITAERTDRLLSCGPSHGGFDLHKVMTTSCHVCWARHCVSVCHFNCKPECLAMMLSFLFHLNIPGCANKSHTVEHRVLVRWPWSAKTKHRDISCLWIDRNQNPGDSYLSFAALIIMKIRNFNPVVVLLVTLSAVL